MGGRLHFIGQRLVKAVFVLLGIIVLNFLLIRLAPGDPALVLAGEAGAADPKLVADLRREFGLDQPVWYQLWIYLRDILSFDLGFSYRQKQPILDLILQRLPQTILLTGTALVFAIVVGVSLGALAARHVGTWWDSIITTAALVIYAMPSFWLGLMLVLLFSVQLGWLPTFGMNTIQAKHTGLAYALDVGRHLVLPALTLGLFFTAVYARLTRASMLEVADMDYVRTGRAKGLPEGRIQRRYILRNALLPVVTYAGLQAGYLVGGSILIETVFAWPGIGRLAFEAVLVRDYNLLLGIFIVASVLVILFNLLTDIVYTIVDPRIELRQLMDFLTRFARNKGAIIGLVVLVAVVLVALLAPILFPQSPWEIAGPPFRRPLEMGFFLGTDTLGRDIAAGIAHGARVTLLLSLVSTFVALSIGVVLGAIAGYHGGIVDDIIMRFTEFFQTIPNFILLVVLVAIFTPSIASIVTAIGIVSWPPLARIVRSEFLSLRSREFVQAAQVLGQSSPRIIFGEILPNSLSPVIVSASLMVATAVLLESALSFLGLGDPNLMSWGYMIGASRTVIRQAWWMSFFPGVAIALTVLALNLVGEGLNDALNPRLARKGRA